MGAVWTSRECFGINLSGERIGVPGFRQPGAGSVRSLLPLGLGPSGPCYLWRALREAMNRLNLRLRTFKNG
jgi:hypothetical protein